jgi:hypothetical protein
VGLLFVFVWINWSYFTTSLEHSQQLPVLFPTFNNPNYFLLPYVKIQYNNFPKCFPISLKYYFLFYFLLFYSFNLLNKLSLSPSYFISFSSGSFFFLLLSLPCWVFLHLLLPSSSGSPSSHFLHLPAQNSLKLCSQKKTALLALEHSGTHQWWQ